MKCKLYSILSGTLYQNAHIFVEIDFRT